MERSSSLTKSQELAKNNLVLHMQKLFNTAQNALNESSNTIEKLRQLSKAESQSAPSSPKLIRAKMMNASNSWSYGEEKNMVSFLQKMKEAVADTFQSAATALRERTPSKEDVMTSPSPRNSHLSWINSFIHYHFLLMGDVLSKPLKLSYGTNVIGRKHSCFSNSDVVHDKRVSVHHLEIVITEDFQITAKLITENPSRASVIKRTTGETVIMATDNVYSIFESDVIFLLQEKYPLTVIASAERPFSSTNKMRLVSWLEETLSIQMNLRGRRSIKARQQTTNLLHQRLLQYKLQRIENWRENVLQSKESNCLFIAVAQTVLGGSSPQDVENLREVTATWLKNNPNYILQDEIKISSFLNDWNEYCDNIKEGNIWGDCATLIAVAEVYGTEIHVLTADPGTAFVIEIIPQNKEINHALTLAHFGDLFFEPIVPIKDELELLDWNPEFSIDPNDLKLGEVIGKGASGEVYIATWNGFKVCAKRISASVVSGKQRELFLREVHILKQLRFPNIILFMGTAEYEDDVFIVMEYMERGSLKDLLAKEPPLNMKMTLRMAIDIAQGMHYLHTRLPKIIHGDLKTANILVNKDYNLKISDFNFAKYEITPNKSDNLYGTIAWIAPELLEHKEITEKADVYSFAVVMWSLLTAKEPYIDLNEFQIITGVLTENLRPEIPDTCLADYAELMKQCWSRDPDARPGFDGILKSLKQMKRGLPSEEGLHQKQALEHDMVLEELEENSNEEDASSSPSPALLESPRVPPFRLTSPISIMNRRRTLSIDTPPLPSVSFAEESPRKESIHNSVVNNNLRKEMFSLNLEEVKEEPIQVLLTPPSLEEEHKSPRKSPREGRLGALSRKVSPRTTAPLSSPRSSPLPTNSPTSFLYIYEQPAKEMWKIVFQELEFNLENDQIGQGASAKVYKGKYRGQYVAIKILGNTPDFSEFEKELAVLSVIRSPDIAYFYGACTSPYYCLVTEYMQNGSLYDLMKREEYKLSWKRVIKFSQQIAKGLNCLHRWIPCIVHRDVKSKNMLVDDRNSIKISDLGLARFTTFDNQDTLFRAKGSLAYMAPEVWTSNADSPTDKGVGFTPKSDVYSFAIVLYELVHRCFFGVWCSPYPNLNPFAVIAQVSKNEMRPKIMEGIPVQFAELIAACWAQKPEERPTCEEILVKLHEIQLEYKVESEKWESTYHNFDDEK